MKLSQMVFVAGSAFSSGVGALEPLGLAVGNGVIVYPAVDVEFSQSDNVYHREAGNETSSEITTLRPHVGVEVDMGSVAILGEYLAELETTSSQDGSSLNHKINASAYTSLAAKHAFLFQADYKIITETLGSESTTGLDDAAIESIDPSSYTSSSLSATYIYGHRRSLFGANISVGVEDKKYTNNEDITRDLSYKANRVDNHLSVKIGHSIRSFVELNLASTNYSSSSAIDKDSKVTRALVGVDWQVTGKTSGAAGFGTEKRNIVNSSDTNSNAAIDLNLVWTPKTYSRISIAYNTGTKETYTSVGGNDAIFLDTSTVSLNWNHSYSVKWNNVIGFSRIFYDYAGSEGVSEETTNVYSFKLMYSPIRVLGVYGMFDKISKYSDVEGQSFDEQKVGLGVTLAI